MFKYVLIWTISTLGSTAAVPVALAHSLARLGSCQLGSCYIISRLWCYIKTAWLPCCVTQHGPSLSPSVCILDLQNKCANTHTHTNQCWGVNTVKLTLALSHSPKMCYLTDGCGRLWPKLNTPERDTAWVCVWLCVWTELSSGTQAE